MEPKNYIEENQKRFVDELFTLLRIPSISSESEHKGDMVKCAERWRELILAAGADKCEVMPAEGNPIVYGEKIIDPNAKTVLVYGHYDVMPVDPVELWHTDPFEPVIKEKLRLRYLPVLLIQALSNFTGSVFIAVSSSAKGMIVGQGTSPTEIGSATYCPFSSRTLL